MEEVKFGGDIIFIYCYYKVWRTTEFFFKDLTLNVMCWEAKWEKEGSRNFNDYPNFIYYRTTN